MSSDNKYEYRILPRLFLRTPHYSFNRYDLHRMPEVLQQQEFQNAVFLASPEFYRVLENKQFEFALLLEKEKHTLHKYYNRMCFRQTPFGSFASFTMLGWGAGEPVKLSKEQSVLHILPDQKLLTLLIQLNAKRPGSLQEDDLIVNPCLYRLNKHFRYPKSVILENGKYEFSLEAIDAVKFNVDLLDFMGKNNISYKLLLEWVMEHGTCNADEAAAYLKFLIDEQVLFSPAQGEIIGQNSLTKADSFVAGWSAFWSKNHLQKIDHPITLSACSGELRKLLISAGKTGSGQVFYAAMERPLQTGGPDSSEQAALTKAVQLLQLLTVRQSLSDLDHFIKGFRERFDREKVPLLLALDPDAGLTYGPLQHAPVAHDALENIRFPVPVIQTHQPGWGAVNQFLFRKWTGDNLRDPWAPLQITEQDFRELENSGTSVLPPPQTQAVMYRSTGEHLVIEHAGGIAAASLIGRFSSFSGEVHRFCSTLASIEIEANPEVVFADIGQLTNSHTDNINRREPIYGYQIPINVYVSQPVSKQLVPKDLWLSLQGDELVLESAQLKKRIIPRLTTAYNFSHNHLPIFRLLCDLQYQGVDAGLSFDLETHFPGMLFYPRVAFGKTIISLAKWHFKEAQLQGFKDKVMEQKLLHLQTFRLQHHIPRHISIGTYDQQLVFDLGHSAEVDFFLNCIQGIKALTIHEYLLPDRSVLVGNKPLAGQYVAFLAHKQIVYHGSSFAKTLKPHRANRNFLIGSDWLYLKIFCTPRLADEILSKVIFSFVNSHRGIIDKWFFIRYTDKGYHLRLRIKAGQDNLGNLLVALNKKLIVGGYERMIKDYQGDTYRREIERYDQRIISAVEELFYEGSKLCCQFLHEQNSKATDWTDFQFGLFIADRMIGCFLTNNESKILYLNRVLEQYLTEFKADKKLKSDLDTKFREQRLLISHTLQNALKIRNLRGLLKSMKVLQTKIVNFSEQEQYTLLADLVHMQLNRTFSSQQRQQELLVYHCLQKCTASLIARNKQPIQAE